MTAATGRRSGASTPRASRPAMRRSSTRSRTGAISIDRTRSNAGSSHSRGAGARSSAGRRSASTRAAGSTAGWPGRASTSAPRRGAEASGGPCSRRSSRRPRRPVSGRSSAGVLVDNTASLALHEGVGFRRVGVQHGDGPGPARPLARRRPARAPERDGRPLRRRPRIAERPAPALGGRQDHETSIVASRPRTSSVRCSRPPVDASASVAASTLMSNSPAAAAEARRAVVLTTSPRAVKSSTAPAGPVGPT